MCDDIPRTGLDELTSLQLAQRFIDAPSIDHLAAELGVSAADVAVRLMDRPEESCDPPPAPGERHAKAILEAACAANDLHTQCLLTRCRAIAVNRLAALAAEGEGETARKACVDLLKATLMKACVPPRSSSPGRSARPAPPESPPPAPDRGTPWNSVDDQALYAITARALQEIDQQRTAASPDAPAAQQPGRSGHEADQDAAALPSPAAVSHRRTKAPRDSAGANHPAPAARRAKAASERIIRADHPGAEQPAVIPAAPCSGLVSDLGLAPHGSIRRAMKRISARPSIATVRRRSGAASLCGVREKALRRGRHASCRTGLRTLDLAALGAHAGHEDRARASQRQIRGIGPAARGIVDDISGAASCAPRSPVMTMSPTFEPQHQSAATKSRTIPGLTIAMLVLIVAGGVFRTLGSGPASAQARHNRELLRDLESQASEYRRQDRLQFEKNGFADVQGAEMDSRLAAMESTVNQMKGVEGEALRAGLGVVASIAESFKQYEVRLKALEDAGFASPTTLNSSQAIDERIEMLRDLRTTNAQLQAALAGAPGHIQSKLKVLGFNPTEIDRAVCGFQQQSQLDSLLEIRAQDERMFAALEEVLLLLRRSQGRWTVDVETGEVIFEDDADLDRYNQLIAQIEEAGSRQIEIQQRCLSR